MCLFDPPILSVVDTQHQGFRKMNQIPRDGRDLMDGNS
jgi:hypothetical protein